MTRSDRFKFDLHWEAGTEATLGPDDEGSLVAEANRRLFRRWTSAGHGGSMVPREAFDVMELRDLVWSLCVYDRDEARDDFHCRVFGSSVAADLGVDMTGLYLSAYPEAIRQVVRSQYDQVIASGRPLATSLLVVRTERSVLYPGKDKRMRHEKLMLPVTRNGQTIDCFITHVALIPAAAQPVA